MWDRAALQCALGIPGAPLGENDIGVVRIDKSGAVRWASAIRLSQSGGIGAIAESDGQIYLAGAVTVPIPPMPNDTSETDVLLVRMSAANGEVVAQRSFDVKRDDSGDLAAPRPGGGFYVAARTGSVQVDTGSVVSPGDITLLSVNPDLTIAEQLTFGSPREESAAQLEVGADNQLLVTGTWDGPITHTPDNERTWNAFWVRLPLSGFARVHVDPRPWPIPQPTPAK
jgi:hypothetical protein